MMKVKFIYDSINLGIQSEIRELQSNLSHEDIKSMFELVFGIPYNSVTCSYEIVQEGELL